MEHLSPDHVLATVEGTLVMVLRRPPPPLVVLVVERRIREAARTSKAPAYLHVVLDVPTTGRVDEPTRTAFIAAAKRTVNVLDVVGMVLMRDGFAGAAMRAMVSSALTVVRPGVPVRIFSTVAPAAQWVAASGAPRGVSRDAAALTQAASEMAAVLLRDFAP
jgi:hypothetical protein